MVTVLVQFPLPASMCPEAFREICRQAAPDFLRPAGLIRKHFLFSEDGRAGGGAYLWESCEAADRFYAAGFREMVAARFGSEPSITYFETPVISDRRLGRVELATRPHGRPPGDGP